MTQQQIMLSSVSPSKSCSYDLRASFCTIVRLTVKKKMYKKFHRIFPIQIEVLYRPNCSNGLYSQSFAHFNKYFNV